MSITGAPDGGPMRVGIPVADLCAGLFCALGILTALVEREKSGEGQWLHTSLLQSQIFMLDFQAARWLMQGEVAPQVGNEHPTSVPTNRYLTKDGAINIAVAGDQIWRRLCKALGRTDWAEDESLASNKQRKVRRDELNAKIQNIVETKSQRRMGRTSDGSRRALRSNLPDRRNVRRSASPAPRGLPAPQNRTLRRNQGARPTLPINAHTEHLYRLATDPWSAHSGNPAGTRIRDERDRRPAAPIHRLNENREISPMTSRDVAMDLPTDKIRAHRQGSVGHIVFNNPDRHNAVSLEMWDAVDLALNAFAEDGEVRVVVLSGAGGKAFVSGADISKFEKERGSKEATEHYNARIKVVYGRVENFPKPTIAMIDGHCIGGGLNLAACCDLRIASEKSKFAMPAAKLALGYPFDAIRRLMNAVGPAAAKQMMFTAKAIDAATAYRLGLVQEVVSEADLGRRRRRACRTDRRQCAFDRQGNEIHLDSGAGTRSGQARFRQVRCHGGRLFRVARLCRRPHGLSRKAQARIRGPLTLGLFAFDVRLLRIRRFRDRHSA